MKLSENIISLFKEIRRIINDKKYYETTEDLLGDIVYLLDNFEKELKDLPELIDIKKIKSYEVDYENFSLNEREDVVSFFKFKDKEYYFYPNFEHEYETLTVCSTPKEYYDQAFLSKERAEEILQKYLISETDTYRKRISQRKEEIKFFEKELEKYTSLLTKETSNVEE